MACSIVWATFLALWIVSVVGQHKHLHHGHQHKHYARQTSKPNVLVIMTDDQDLLLNSLSVMPNVQSIIGGNGVNYTKHYCQNALCCPSRTSFFTGKTSHNTNVTDVSPPYGGWDKFGQQGLNDNYLAVWLNNSGVNTYYVGKFLNSYGQTNLATPAPPRGWTNSTFLVDPFIANYLNSLWTNGVNAQSTADTTQYKGTHTTDITSKKALDMIDEAAKDGKQFFMMIAPVAPHLQSGGNTNIPPIPAKYANTFTGRQAPRGANFNPTVASGASWVYKLPRLSSSQLTTADKVYAARLGNLAYVDDMVGNLTTKLQQKGLLDNTYIIFTTDNGFHIGNHRLVPGKRCPYEEDINIPLMIRGPDVPAGVTSNLVNSHIDMTPTILQMLGVPIQDSYAFDGAVIPYTSSALATTASPKLLQVESWTGQGSIEGLPAGQYFNNTYKALRMITDGNSFFYSKWCTGEKEFYNMNTDPGQMKNRLGTPARGTAATYYGRAEAKLFTRLDALLMVAKSCKQDSCRNPWATLFPGGQVSSLSGAMAAQYDTFFVNQPKVSYSSCQLGYVLSEEGPQSVTPYS